VESSRIVLVIEYDGTNYHGFQLQVNLPTIQEQMEKALWKLTQERIRVASASRTDAGVHAKGQVTSFRTKSHLSLESFIKGMNYYLSGDIAVNAAYRVDNTVNIRRDAISREYSYYILNRRMRSPLRRKFSYLVSHELDIDAMKEACSMFIGKYDFVSFASKLGVEIKNTVRSVYRAEISRKGDLTTFNIVANSFLPHQVRNTIGSLLRVGSGRMTIDEFRSIMEAKKIGSAGPAVPACGLCLMQVNYPYTF